VQKPSAIVFNSSYLANQTVLATLGRHMEHCLFISDAENHASMIEGMRASKRDKIIFRHNDMGHLAEILQTQSPERPKIIAFESVYSMSGTMAPIRDIVALAKQYNALTYCDEVHAVGLYGEHGGGLIAQVGASDGVDLINGTFAKAFGVIGGFVAGSEPLIDFIRSHAEGFIFTTSLPPSNCAAIIKSIETVGNEPETRRIFHQNIVLFRKLLDQMDIPYQGRDAHITRIVIGDSQRCKTLTDRLLFEHGIYLQPINFPTVARGEESMRVIVSARHHDFQIEQLALALKTVLS
jgi:5-aminolevulinate synthase